MSDQTRTLGDVSPEWADALSHFADWLRLTGRAKPDQLASPETVTARAERDTREDVYVRHVTMFARATDEGPWTTTTPALLEWLESRRWSAETRRKVVVSLRSFYAWATSEALCEWAPTAGLPTLAHKRPGPPRRVLSPLWVDALNDHLTYLQAGARTRSTIELRRSWVTRLAESSTNPWRISTRQLTLWISNPDWNPSTRRSARSNIQCFYEWGTALGYVDTNPAAGLPIVRVPRALPRPVPSEAIIAAFTQADDRQRIALKLGAYAGLRRAEIARVHTRDMDAETGTLFVVGKGGHQRKIPLHPDLAEELRMEIQRRRNGTPGSGFSGEHTTAHGYLFASSHGGHLTPAHLGKIITATLPEGWTTHTLRHRFATLAYATDRDLRAVQELLGHSKPETTARYAATPDGALESAIAGIAL